MISKNLLRLGTIVVFFAVTSSSLRAEDAAKDIHPSRAPEKGCTWEKVSSGSLSVLAQQCDFGFRKIQHVFENNTLVEKYSDSGAGAPGDKIIEFFEKDAADSPDAALKKQFIEKLSDYEKQHCVARETKSKDLLEKPFKDKSKSAWIIEPDKVYAAKIAKETPKGDMPPDSCGEYGLPVDSRAYFEFHAGNKSRFAWVLVGQDTPLFDEQSIEY